MIRIDAIWLALGASDLRGGIDSLLAQVLRGFGQGVQPHHAYIFANRRATRLKVLGLWLCLRRLQAGSFAWPREGGQNHSEVAQGSALSLTREQLDWLVAGLPWQRLSQGLPKASPPSKACSNRPV